MNTIYFCIKTKDGRYMPVVNYIKNLEDEVERLLKHG